MLPCFSGLTNYLSGIAGNYNARRYILCYNSSCSYYRACTNGHPFKNNGLAPNEHIILYMHSSFV
ncbi:hypothetical protein RDSD_001057 [Oleidesulfovibrio alaskensis]